MPYVGGGVGISLVTIHESEQREYQSWTTQSFPLLPDGEQDLSFYQGIIGLTYHYDAADGGGSYFPFQVFGEYRYMKTEDLEFPEDPNFTDVLRRRFEEVNLNHSFILGLRAAF